MHEFGIQTQWYGNQAQHERKAKKTSEKCAHAERGWSEHLEGWKELQKEEAVYTKLPKNETST